MSLFQERVYRRSCQLLRRVIIAVRMDREAGLDPKAKGQNQLDTVTHSVQNLNKGQALWLIPPFPVW